MINRAIDWVKRVLHLSPPTVTVKGDTATVEVDQHHTSEQVFKALEGKGLVIRIVNRGHIEAEEGDF